MQFWAILWHIRELTEQPIALGGVGLVRVLPIIVFSLVGGAIADVFDRRRVIFVTQTVFILTATTLGLLTISGRITIWQIYLLTAIEALASSFDLPARQALTPNLVPARDLPNAFSMQSMAFTVGAIIGPALSGLVISFAGLSMVYWINAATYLALVWALIQIGSVTQQPVDLKGRSPVSWASIKEGLNFILARPIILSSMFLDFFATFFSSANALLPIFARDILRVGEQGYGWLAASQSVGAGVTAVILSQVGTIRHQGRILLGAVISFGIWTLVFGLSPFFGLTFLSLAMMGASDTISMIIRNTIRQLRTPDHIRGRMTSINQIFFMGGPQLGELEAGIVAQFFGAPLAVITGGIGCILAVGWTARKWPQLLNYEGEENQDG